MNHNLISRRETLRYDVVVIGGGLSGVCAAIASARHGAKTALLQNRSMLGGNASSEIRMHVCGASCQQAKKNVNETGILLELMLENKRLNPRFNFNIWDTVLLDAVRKTEGLELFLNTEVYDLICENDVIRSVQAVQSSTERRLTFEAPIFLDATGHGTVGFFAGAEYRMGSEGKDEFGEADAPDEENGNLMGNTLLFKAIDTGHPVSFTKPDWARTFTEEDLRYRVHTSFTGTLNGGKITAGENAKGLPELYCADYGYWWIELGGDSDDIIGKSEEIRDELMSCLWGVWDHIKNGGDHHAENFDLQWCGIIPGSRDSRRLVGDYLLNENDILSNRVFEDAVAYGGWAMDVHTPGGMHDLQSPPSRVINFDGLYTIPYRSYYSVNIKNLLLAGRIISATKLGMSSARVMATCSVGGQAAGTAAALCIRHKCLPRELGQKHIQELQQTLLRDDCYLPGIEREDPENRAPEATATATSELPDFPASNVLTPLTRASESATNAWRSAKLGAEGESLTLTFGKPIPISEIRLVFDPDLSGELAISLSSKKQKRQIPTLPPMLVKDYDLILYDGKKEVLRKAVTANHDRLRVHRFDTATADRIVLTVKNTYGADYADVFRVMVF